MRAPRDFRPQQLYGVTQRGNGGQWVHRDRQDFEEARRLMIRYARMHDVKIHFYIQLHNHSHWVFEASDEESISNLMRDMQGNYSRYLNRKYRKTPWLLRAPLSGAKRRRGFSKYLRAGPVNWSPRFDAEPLDAAGAKSFGRYVENNAVEAGLVKRARRWRWSSAAAHGKGSDEDGVLCLDRWRWMFGNPETIVEEWTRYLDAPREERRRNSVRLPLGLAARLPVRLPHNRPKGWFPPVVERAAAASGGLPD